MKLLLDENLPRKLAREFAPHEVFTVADMGWQGKANGELLASLLDKGFDTLITADKNLQHQQNFDKYPIPVIVLHARLITYPDLQPVLPKVLSLRKANLPTGPHVVRE